MTGDIPKIDIVHPQLRERLEKIEIEVPMSLICLGLIFVQVQIQILIYYIKKSDIDFIFKDMFQTKAISPSHTQNRR